MYGKSLHIGKIRGIGFEIHYTWFLIFLLLTISLGLEYSDIYPNWPSLAHWMAGLFSALLLFASVLAHELAHSLVALKCNVPVRSITLFFFGGVAQITREASSPKAEFRIAIAGPVCSIGLAIIFGAVWLLSHGQVEFIEGIAGYLALINIMLAGFNLIPGFPLDGGRLLRSLIWSRTGDYDLATRIALLGGRIIAYALIASGVGGTIVISWTQREFWAGGLWLALIGWFLQTAVRASSRQARMKQILKKITVREAMTPCHLLGFLWPASGMGMVGPDDDGLATMSKMDQGQVDQLAVVENGKVVGLIRRENLLRLAEWAFKNRGERI